MDIKKTGEMEYMTVGEIASRAGVTVRTVQYYDQKGLLSPSAKGSRNLRLYTKRDLEKLYRILCCKFLGLPLEEIRSLEQEEMGPREVAEMLKQRIREEEEALSEQMKRYAMLRNLEDYTSNHRVTDWEAYAGLIDYLQEKWKLIWEVSRLSGEGILPDGPGSEYEEMKSLYRMASETIRLMGEGVPPQSEEAMRIIEELEKVTPAGDSGGDGAERIDILHIDPGFFDTGNIDFSDLWTEIRKYLRTAKESRKKEMGTEAD